MRQGLISDRDQVISEAFDDGCGFRRLNGSNVFRDQDGLFGLDDHSAVGLL